MTLDRTYRIEVGVCTAIRWFSGSMIRKIVKRLHMGAYITAKKENINFFVQKNTRFVTFHLLLNGFPLQSQVPYIETKLQGHSKPHNTIDDCNHLIVITRFVVDVPSLKRGG